MAKTDKADKLVGGNGVRLDKVAWAIEEDGIQISGTSANPTQAALDALAARRAIQDAAKKPVSLTPK